MNSVNQTSLIIGHSVRAAETPAANANTAIRAEVFRFSFETDQQFCARICPVTSQPPHATTHPKVAGASSHTGTFLIIPWWGLVLGFLILVIGFYESHRRKLMSLLRQRSGMLPLPETKRPSKWSRRLTYLVQKIRETYRI